MGLFPEVDRRWPDRSSIGRFLVSTGAIRSRQTSTTRSADERNSHGGGLPPGSVLSRLRVTSGEGNWR